MNQETLVDSRKRMKGMKPGDAVKYMRQTRTALSEKSLGVWGITNVYIIVIQMFLIPFGSYIGMNFGNLNKFFMFSVVAWISAVLVQKIAPLRLPGAMIGIVLLQLWFTVATVASQLQLGRAIEFFAADYSFAVYLLCFVQGSMLSYFMPQYRKTLMKTVIGICIVSSIFAGLQFAGVGPAIQLANIMMTFGDITNWAGQGGVRAVGIFPALGAQVTYGLIAIGFIASALYYRKLRTIEIGIVILLTGTMLMAQVRNALVLLAVVMIPLVILYIRRTGVRAVPMVGIGVVSILVLLFTGGDRFDYVFSGDTSTFDYRTDVLWPQAKHIFAERPWFGIGVEPAFAGFRSGIADRWSSGMIMDNGYLVSLAFGGIPAFTFLCIAVLAGAFGAMRLLRRKNVTPIERGYAIAAGIIVLHFGYGMYFNNLYTNTPLGMLYFVIAGFALPSRESIKETVGKGKKKRGLLIRKSVV